MDIPDEAKRCPYCCSVIKGLTVPAKVGLFFVVLVGFVVLLAFIGGRSASGPSSTHTQTTPVNPLVKVRAQAERMYALTDFLDACARVHKRNLQLCVDKAQAMGYTEAEMSNSGSLDIQIYLYRVRQQVR